MGDFLWTFAAEEVVKKVVKVAAEQVGLVSGFEDHLSNLQIWLRKAEDFLCDINSRKLHHLSARTWVSNLHHLAVQADNLLDEIAYEHHRQKLQTSKLKKVTNFVSPSTNAFIFRRNMAKNMKILIELLEKHYNEAAAPLGLEGIKYARPEIDVISQLRETISELDDHKIVGRDNEVESIVKQVIDASNQQGTSILPIVGMGGLGKTTVAKLVFNHEMIRQHFDKFVWVCVSEFFVVNKILGDILQNLTHDSNVVGDSSREVLLHKLQKEMQGQIYFLVLDDVWNDDDFLWDELKYCLLRITENSKNCIVVTTRSVDVAKIMETCPSYHLSKLLDDQCWSLFMESANACGIPMTSNLEIVRKELVKKIGGLPLVARVLGRAVKFEGDDERWVKVLEGVLRTPLQEEHFVLSILKLSVDRLPSSSLKQCFAYCSNFPKDYEFEKQELVQMWMAQGFIRPQEGKNSTTMENVGDMYFRSLLSRCLFQDVFKDDQGRIQGCKMHDLIHDVACAISSDQDLKLNPSNMLGKELQKKVESKKVARTLHTIDFVQMICNIDQKVFDVKIKNFVSLRVLKMSRSSIYKLPDSIGQLKHLRYLEISNGVVPKLPKSISLLYNLQTLKIRIFVFENLPENLTNLVNLRHVELPMNVKKMPPHFSQLTQLQTLSCFVVGFEKGCKITELGHLKNLQGRLELFDLEKVESKEEACRADLAEKENLDELEFTWSCERKDNRYNDLEVLEGLQPNKNIQSLKIFYFAGNCLPNKIFVENLRVIGLHGCKNCEKLPMLGQLNSLKKLEIEFLNAVQSIGNEFYGNDSNQRTFFPKLEIFILSDMINLEQWEKLTTDNASSNCITSFPYLKELRIEGCPKLLNIPDVFGGCDENDVQHLEILRVSHCNKLTKLPNGLHLCGSIQQVRIHNGSNLSINLRNKPKLGILSIGPLEKLPEDLCHVKNLSVIKIVGCMQNYDFSLLHSLPFLKALCLESLSSVTQLPQQLQHLTVLQFLSIEHFEGIEVLPEWLENLVSLNTLRLSNCKILKQLPSTEAMLRLTNLRELHISKCPLLPLGEGGTEKIKLPQLPTIEVYLN